MITAEISAEERELRTRVKHELRRRMRMTRDALPARARALRSQKIAEAVMASKALNDARVIAAYCAVRSEASVATVVQTCWAQGKTVVFPRVEGSGLVFHRVQSEDELEEGSYGIQEPRAEAPMVNIGAIEFMLVPALAADPAGFRIGYGGGYYDRTLPHVTGSTCVTVYDFQLISEVPTLENDVPVGAIVTDARTIDVKS